MSILASHAMIKQIFLKLMTQPSKDSPSKDFQSVSGMFASIATRYDITNDVLSFGMHRLWERKAINQLPDNSQLRCLDLCTGTGALLPELLTRYQRVVGADFCKEMLKVAEQKYNKYTESGQLSIEWADAMDLQYQENSFDIVTIAYGVRNFENLEQGLKEVRRVLKPNGQLLILEFGQPTGLIKPLYRFYSKYIMPVLGKLLTGNKSAYEYLPATAGTFPCGDEFLQYFDWAGSKKFVKLMGGIAYIYLISGE